MTIIMIMMMIIMITMITVIIILITLMITHMSLDLLAGALLVRVWFNHMFLPTIPSYPAAPEERKAYVYIYIYIYTYMCGYIHMYIYIYIDR